MVGTLDLFGTAASSLFPLRMASVPSLSVPDSLGYSPFPGALVRRIATARSGPGEWACEPGSWKIAFHAHRHEFFQVLAGHLRVVDEAELERILREKTPPTRDG